MFILSCSERFEKSEDKIFTVDADDLDGRYLDGGYQRHERSYSIIYEHSEYTVICPEYRNGEKGGEPIVVIPVFLIPGRPFMAEVYLYAIDLYSAAPDKGQRWAAEETRKRFNLKTFAHTTLGRALKSLAGKLAGVEAGTAVDAGCPDYEGLTEKPEQGRFPTVRKTKPSRERAARFLRGRVAHQDRNSAKAACHEIAREWFSAYRHFLL